MLTQKKKNQAVRYYSAVEKAQLKKRYVIENLFCRLDSTSPVYVSDYAAADCQVSIALLLQ
jgi:hypothetical protein